MESGTIVAIIAAIFISISASVAARQFRMERKLRTLDYVSRQFDTLEQIGAREEKGKMGSQPIMNYIAGDDEKRQKLLQYVYAFNRIGAGIFSKSLNESIIFNIWSPRWIEGNWQTFEPLVSWEKQRRGEEASGASEFFRWLAEEKCIKVKDKYPQNPATLRNRILSFFHRQRC